MLHMLVEGIPVDDCGSLFDCMQRSGGIAEGFTEDVFSNFELEATDIYTFEKSLNNFLGILGKPTLNRLKVVEQAKEIEGEDTITLVGDNWKLQDIIKILAKPEHPISHKQSLWMADK
jgi:secreted Zn-dependent insulinase-like peptidase